MQKIDSLEDVDRGLNELVVVDPRLIEVRLHAHRVPLRRSSPGFKSLASIIVGQQLSTASAGAIWGRLSQHIDPMTPENFITAGEVVWQAAGLSHSKKITLSGLADALISGTMDLRAVSEMEAEEAVSKLIELKGIGPWTAEVYLLFAEGHPDVFPSGDVALQTAIGHALGYEKRPDAKVLRSLAEQWAPWRGVAARLFWAYYAAIKGREATPL